ncbi:MAG: hypothetical protein WBE76_00425, partial [Terracidiphilus sp.]
MARLSIPARYRAALSSIRSLSDDNVRAIRAVLEQAQTAIRRVADQKTGESIDPDDIVKSLQISGTNVPIKNLRDVLEAILSLYVLKSRKDISTEQFVDDVCDAMERLDPAQRIEHENRADYAGKLRTLLNANSFAIVTKAIDLATEDERTFCQARIITDLRPVFGQHVEDGPQAMVVVHLLKLAFHEQGNARDHGEFYVALDTSELSELNSLWCNRPFSARSAVNCLNEKSIGQNENSARTALNRACWPV